MNSPYRTPNTSQHERRYGPFPFPWMSLLVLLFLFAFTWAFWRVAVVRERVECAGGVAQGRCVFTTHLAFEPYAVIRHFKASTLQTVRLEEVVHPHSKGKGVTIKGRLHLIFDRNGDQPLDELSLSEARATQAQFLAFIANTRSNASFDSGDHRWQRWLSLLGLISMLAVLRWAWVRRAPVRLRWLSDTHTLEVTEAGFFRSTTKHFEVPSHATFHVKWNVENSARSRNISVSLEMDDERGKRTQLTRDRTQGIGVHYQGVVELYHVMERMEPRPMRAPHAPTAGNQGFFSGWFVPAWIGLTCGSLLGMFLGIVFGLELHLVHIKDNVEAPLFLGSAIAGFVGLTSLLLYIAHQHKRDLALYKQLTGH